MLSLGQDLRYACRLLARSPGYTCAVILLLALGMGANSAIFSVVDAVLLRPLPFHDPGQLVMLWEQPPSRRNNRVSPLNFQDWHDQNTVFSSLAAIGGNSPTLQTASGPEQIPGQNVTSEFFTVLGVRPLLGRAFSADDDRRRASAALISEDLWRSHFSADPAIVGRSVPLSGKLYQVIGVMPAGFQFQIPAQIWTLFTVDPAPVQRRMHYLQVIGRLKPGVTLARANTAMAVIAASISRISPATNKNFGIALEPVRDGLVTAELRNTSLLLAAVAGFVLMMACVNTAGLLLVRGAARVREMAVRISLGAPSARLVRQLLTESLLLSIAGGSAGMLLAWALIHAAPSLIAAGTLPAGIAVRLDYRIAGFSALVTVFTGLACGSLPARQVTRHALALFLRGGRGITSHNSKLLGAFAAAEMAMAVTLACGAGLFLQTLHRLGQVDPGFHAHSILTMQMTLPLSRYSPTASRLAFYQAAQREIETVPGVRAAAFGASLPLKGFDIGQPFTLAGETHAAHYQIVGASYFETLGIPLLSGRPFDSRDLPGAPPVAIVNREFVRRYLPDRPAIGARIRIAAMENSGPRMVERQIVGVAGQVRVDNLGESENVVEVYVPVTQNPWYSPSLAVRTAGDPLALAAAVKAAIAKVDPELAVTHVSTMDEIASDSAARPRFRARLLSGFAALAILLSAAGIFGVLAFSVAQRTREFGIRVALGARGGQVLRMVLSQAAAISLTGIAAGLLGAAALARAASALLFGVRPFDPRTLLASAVLLALVGFSAAALPALRAARVDPAITLRDE